MFLTQYLVHLESMYTVQYTVKCVKFLYLVYRQIISLFFNNLLDTQ